VSRTVADDARHAPTGSAAETEGTTAQRDAG